MSRKSVNVIKSKIKYTYIDKEFKVFSIKLSPKGSFLNWYSEVRGIAASKKRLEYCQVIIVFRRRMQ